MKPRDDYPCVAARLPILTRRRSHQFLVANFIRRMLAPRLGELGRIVGQFVGAGGICWMPDELVFQQSVIAALPGPLSSIAVATVRAVHRGSCLVTTTEQYKANQNFGHDLMASHLSSAVAVGALAAWPYLMDAPKGVDPSVLLIAPRDVTGAVAKLVAKFWSNAFPHEIADDVITRNRFGQGSDGIRLLYQRFNSYGQGGRLDPVYSSGCSIRVELPSAFLPLPLDQVGRSTRGSLWACTGRAGLYNRGLCASAECSNCVSLRRLRLVCIMYPESANSSAEGAFYFWTDVVAELVKQATPPAVFVWSGRMDADMRGEILARIPNITCLVGGPGW